MTDTKIQRGADATIHSTTLYHYTVPCACAQLYPEFGSPYFLLNFVLTVLKVREASFNKVVNPLVLPEWISIML